MSMGAKKTDSVASRTAVVCIENFAWRRVLVDSCVAFLVLFPCAKDCGRLLVDFGIVPKLIDELEKRFVNILESSGRCC